VYSEKVTYELNMLVQTTGPSSTALYLLP